MSVMQHALKRRIAPSIPLTLDLRDDDGSQQSFILRLSFDFNAFALIYERTGVDMANEYPFAKKNLAPPVLSVMLWAATLACHPEYHGEEGLGVIRSYMDVDNQELIQEKLFAAWTENMPEQKKQYWRDLLEKAKSATDADMDPTQASPTALRETPMEAAKNL